MRQCAFIGASYKAILHFLSLCSSRHRLSPYLRVEFNLFLQFFILPTLSFSPPPSFRFSPSANARFLLFIRASSKLLSEWLRRVVTRLTHVHSFLFFALISQFLRESGWISIIINLYNSKGNLSKFSSCSY